MKKGFVFILTAILLFSMFTMSINAAESQVKLNPIALGVKNIGSTAAAGDYMGEGVVNLRCAYSNWDNAENYLWFISNWSAATRANPASVKIGNYNMAEIKKVAFDYVTDVASTMNNKVSLTKDAAGTQKLATVDVTESTGQLANPKHLEMQILDTTYEGDMYLFIEYDGVRMFVGNVTLTIDDASEPGTEPETNPPTENPQTGDTANLAALAAIAVLGVLTVVKRKAGCGI